MSQSPERKLIRTGRKRIHPDPDNPRQAADPKKLAALAASLKANGQQVPLIVRPHPTIPGDYLLIDGWRRWLAALQAELDELEAVVVEGAMDKIQLLALTTSLGVTNEKLNPYELADAAETIRRELGITQEEVAKMLGVSAATLSKAISVTTHLAEELKADVESGDVPFTSAAALARLREMPVVQIELAARIKKGALKRDAVAAEVAKLLGKKAKKPKPVKATLPGLTVVLSPTDVAKARSMIAQVDAALVKLEKLSMPLELLQQFLKNPPQN